MRYDVFIEPRALADLRQAIDYYNTQQRGLGEKFETAIDKHLSLIGQNPFYQIRYHYIRCLPVKKFPFMIHFFVDEKSKKVFIVSVLHTSKNPDSWMLP
ncbi:MAG TPA: type II toxin-antitoxin system RelE/ParE family toxin [Bacteroidia bacterium]|nr:type II toxin-antitoxin system RelE/ParE family toxin [Bacteroidia bacterium]